MLVQVVQMMSSDLLRQQQKWKDSLMEIRQIMTNLVQQVTNECFSLVLVAFWWCYCPVMFCDNFCICYNCTLFTYSISLMVKYASSLQEDLSYCLLAVKADLRPLNLALCLPRRSRTGYQYLFWPWKHPRRVCHEVEKVVLKIRLAECLFGSTRPSWCVILADVAQRQIQINMSSLVSVVTCLQCFDAVCWTAGRASGL